MNDFLRCSPLTALALAGSLLLALPSSSEAQEQCTEWSRWDPVHPLPILWSWRWCTTTSERFDVQWRFANTGTEPIEFEYDLFTGMVSAAQCGEDNRGRRFAGGKYKLEGGQWDERYARRRTLRQSGFQQRFWLYLCLRTQRADSPRPAAPS
jgi:hypothetical protein